MSFQVHTVVKVSPATGARVIVAAYCNEEKARARAGEECGPDHFILVATIDVLDDFAKKLHS